MARSDFVVDVYDPNEIYSGTATDDHGHSSNMRCAIPTEWAGAIAEIVASPEWPEIKTAQTFIRDAVHHRLHWAADQKNRGTISAVRNLQALEEASATLSRHEEFRSSYERFSTRMEDALKLAMLNDDSVLMSMIEDLYESIPKFPEPYRTKLSERLDYWKRMA